METRNAKKYSLGNTKVFICPACGVVNPAGPSERCPHLQVIKFEGVDEKLEDLIMETAAARKHYAQLVDSLKIAVMNHVHQGTAHVETPRKIKEAEIEKLYSSANKNFYLSHPDGPDSKRTIKKKSRLSTPKKTTQKEENKDKQLELLSLFSSKIDA